jgi:outer membrane putative beta-barrel porin/alpha-amylase
MTLAPGRRHDRFPPWPTADAAVALASAIICLASHSAPSQAQNPAEPLTREELEHALQQRDAVIRELSRRVEQLERGAAPGAGPTPPAAPTAEAPTPAPPATPPAPEERAPPQTAETKPHAPGQVEVNEEAAERALEFTLVQQGALLLPFGSNQFAPSFTYTRQTVDFPIVRGAPGNQVIGERNVRRNEFDFSANLLAGLPFDSQLELGLPYNLVEQKNVDTVGGAAVAESSNTGHGLGDFSVGLAKTVLRERNWLPDVILRADWSTGTGENRDNHVVLGGGFQELTGSISLTKRQDPLVFVAGASYQAAFEHDDIDPGDTLGFGLGTFLAASPDTSLSVVLNQNFIDEVKVNGQKIGGSDQVESILSFGASVILARNMLLDVTVGVGLTDDSPDYSVSVSLPIRFSTPGF